MTIPENANESETSNPPHWKINLPPSDCPETCPEFLKDLSQRDIEILTVPAEKFHYLTWPDVRDLIRQNKLNGLQRAPLDHRRYLKFVWGLKKAYGSVMEFVLQKRVRWVDSRPKAMPFEDLDDITVLYNDWPYGLDPKIVHLVVWTKFELDDDPDTGEVITAMRGLIEKYVDETFKSKILAENVIWFKNWRSLKSIHALEHFHVMLYDPDPTFMSEVTKGDRPASQWIDV